MLQLCFCSEGPSEVALAGNLHLDKYVAGCYTFQTCSMLVQVAAILSTCWVSRKEDTDMQLSRASLTLWCTLEGLLIITASPMYCGESFTTSHLRHIALPQDIFFLCIHNDPVVW